MKVIAIIKYVFSVIGLGMLLGTLYLYSNTKDFLEFALTTEGTVTQLVRSSSSDSVTYRPVVEFTTRSGRVIEFVSSSGSYPPAYSNGETVEVMYQEEAPEGAIINGFFSLWGGVLILGILGFVIFVIGISIVVIDVLNGQRVKYLKKNGVPVIAQFQGVGVNKMFEINGVNPYQIFAHWQDPVTSDLHIFNSENIWFDPEDFVNQDEITVLIDKKNPKKYYMDISFLPKVVS